MLKASQSASKSLPIISSVPSSENSAQVKVNLFFFFSSFTTAQALMASLQTERVLIEGELNSSKEVIQKSLSKVDSDLFVPMHSFSDFSQAFNKIGSFGVDESRKTKNCRRNYKCC